MGDSTLPVAEKDSSASSDLQLVEGFGRGLASDIKGKAKFLKSDITDGFSIKVS